jgi:hypothetical protein
MIQVEGNINFYEELKKQLNGSKNDILTITTPNNNDGTNPDNETDINNIDESNIINTIQNDEYIGRCLITNEKLKEGYVTMLCNHSFNYIPLFNDLLHHKKTLYLETQMLKTNEIRCPYCRNKQSILLPYYECMGVPKISGINYFKRAGTFVGNCEYNELRNIIKSKEWYSNLKVKLFHEHDPTVICSNIVSVLKEDDKCYCSFHKVKAKSLYYKNKSYEKRLIIKKQKQAEKQNNQQIPSDNLVIDMNLCNVILASGKNKGLQCSQKPYCNEKCKRHYNLQIKTNLLKITEEDHVAVDTNVNTTANIVVDNNLNIQHDISVISDNKKYKKISSKFVQNYMKTIQN